MINLLFTNKLTYLGTPVQNNMEINILNGLQAKYKWIAKEFTKGEFIFTKGEENAQYDEKYIVGKDKIPFKNKHGILPDILENLLKNNINDKIKKGRLNNGEYGFLRKGKASPNNSFINAASNYHDQSGLWLIEKIIKNLDPLTFVNLNRENVKTI